MEFLNETGAGDSLCSDRDAPKILDEVAKRFVRYPKRPLAAAMSNNFCE